MTLRGGVDVSNITLTAVFPVSVNFILFADVIYQNQFHEQQSRLPCIRADGSSG